MSNAIIRPDSSGIALNYGTMGVGNVGGMPYAVSLFYAEQLKLRVEPRLADKMPEFQQEACIWVESGNSQRTVYALEHEDLVPLAKALAVNLGVEFTVSIVYLVRILRRYRSDELLWSALIEDFYVDLTEEQIRLGTLKER